LKSWSWLGLEQARLLLGLEQVTVGHVFQLFAMSTNDDGYLSKDAYIGCFAQILNRHPLLSSMGPLERLRAIHIVQVLFDTFAVESADFVDFTAICTGVAVLFGDYRQHVDGTVFSLYDYEEKGAIGLDDMVRYLSCIFRVMYALQPGTSMRMGVGVFELAHATAAEAFASGTLTEGGDLPFDEFLRWYNEPITESKTSSESAVLSIIEIRRLTNLVRHPIDEVFEVFAKHTDADGYVDFDAFVVSFEALAHDAVLGDEDLASRTSLLQQLFDIFDAENIGRVDFTELMSALSIFCVGPKLEKIQAVFTLYDYNERGYIAPDEMNRYFRSVFRMYFALQPHMQQHVGVTAEDLASLMTKRCFAECSLGEDGHADFDSFASWLLRGDFGETDQAVNEDDEKSTSGDTSEVDDESAEEQVEGGADKDELPGPQLSQTSLVRVRQLTRLQEFSAQEVCDIFAEQSTKDGFLTFEEFHAAARLIVQCGGGCENEADKQAVEKLYGALFRAFDANDDGTVSYEELLSGILVLCGGTRDDKVKTAFALFDRDGTGSISKSEMERYLTSVFRILYEVSPATAGSIRVSAEQLGQTTASQCFEDIELNNDGQVKYEEFAKWYLAPQ